MEDPQAVPSAPPSVAAANGLADNVAGALAYITLLPAILFLILEQYNKRPFIRFHAFQCVGLFIMWVALSFFFVIPILGWIVGGIGLVLVAVCWIVAILKAYQGQRWKVPVIGNYAEKFAEQ